MNKKIVAILVILMMNLLIIPASSNPTSVTESIKKIKKQQLQIMIFCVIDISGEGQIWSLPGVLVWRIDDGSINITYLGGEFNASSGQGLFILHLGTKTDNPINISGVATIGILF